jgi:hypothetical protein
MAVGFFAAGFTTTVSAAIAAAATAADPPFHVIAKRIVELVAAMCESIYRLSFEGAQLQRAIAVNASQHIIPCLVYNGVVIASGAKACGNFNAGFVCAYHKVKSLLWKYTISKLFGGVKSYVLSCFVQWCMMRRCSGGSIGTFQTSYLALCRVFQLIPRGRSGAEKIFMGLLELATQR